MSTIEEIDRGTLNRFLVTPASRLAIMNASVAEQAVSTVVQTLIIVLLGLAGGASYPGGAAGIVVLISALVIVVKRARGIDTDYSSLTVPVIIFLLFLFLGIVFRFLRSGKIGSTTKGQLRQLKAVGRWQASASRGGIKSRSWVRPIFGAKAPAAIEAFRDTFLKLIDAAISVMPK